MHLLKSSDIPSLRRGVARDGYVLCRELCFATPALIGGATAAQVELRTSSLLGALRFWWRAGVCPAPGDMAEMRRAEMRLFGGPADDRVGSGLFVARLVAVDPTAAQPQTIVEWTGKGERKTSLGCYLGGAVSGFRDKHGKWLDPKRKLALPLEMKARLQLLLRRHATKDDRDQLNGALDLLCRFGGVGLLARRGMGSVNDLADRDLGPAGFSARMRSQYSELGPDRNLECRRVPSFSRHAVVALWRLPGLNGPAALGRLARQVEDFCDQKKSSGGRPDPDAVFSDQTRANRQPSCLHVHVQRFPGGCVVVLTFLPTSSPNGVGRWRGANERISEFLDSFLPGRLKADDYERLGPR